MMITRSADKRSVGDDSPTIPAIGLKERLWFQYNNGMIERGFFMNEDQRLLSSQVTAAGSAGKHEKDYSQYFQNVYTAPSLKDAKKRGKEQVSYVDNFAIDPRFENMGRGRKFYIRTYGCQMNEHDTCLLYTSPSPRD